jgi:hypothetical protein
MATLRNRVIGMLCQAGPVNLAAALRHHAGPLTTLGILLRSSPHERTFRENAGALGLYMTPQEVNPVMRCHPAYGRRTNSQGNLD